LYSKHFNVGICTEQLIAYIMNVIQVSNSPSTLATELVTLRFYNFWS